MDSNSFPKLCQGRNMPAKLSKAFRRFESAVRQHEQAQRQTVKERTEACDELGEARRRLVEQINALTKPS